MKVNNVFQWLVVLGFGCLVHGVAFGSSARVVEELPVLSCDRFDCSFITPVLTRAPEAPAVADPTPTEAGPPPGQRLQWLAPASPICQSLKATRPTYANPYEYFKSTNVSVPLGSTHVTLRAGMEGQLSGGPSGAAGIYGLLQIRRSGSTTWENVRDLAIHMIHGSTEPQATYGNGLMDGLVNLSLLAGPDVGSVPSKIDVRVAVFNSFTASFTQVNWDGICRGSLEVWF